MKTAEQLSKILEDVFTNVEQAINATAEADSLLMFAQFELADTRSKILTAHDAADLGKNEAQREAKILELTTAERQRVRKAEQRRHEERGALEIARMRKEHALADLRLLELAGGVVRETPLRLA